MPLSSISYAESNSLVRKLENFSYSQSGKRTSLWPSDAGHCARRTTLTLKSENLKSTVDFPKELTFKMGHTVENLVLQVLFEQDVLLWKDYNLPTLKIGGYEMRGRIDGIVWDNGKVKILEIKSCNALPTEPSKENYAQAQIYSAITGLDAIVLYVSRNPYTRKEGVKARQFNLSFDPAPIENLFKGIQSFETDTLTPKLAMRSLCGFCPFVGFCWNKEPNPDFESLKEIETLNVSVRVERFMAYQENRRNGILKHIEASGSKLAKSVLKNEWSKIV